MTSSTERFFHWELEFSDVFTGERGGFDAVFGNPPYVNAVELDRQDDSGYKHFWSTHSPRS